MRKGWILLLLGLVPFPLGWLSNWLIWNVSSRWINWHGVVLLALWFFFAYRFSRLCKNTAQAVLLLNLPAAVVFLLLVIQQAIFHAYWINLVGVWTQIFYLPLLSLAFRLTPWSHGVFPAYCAAFLLLIAVSLLGGYAYRRRVRRKQYH